MITRLLIEVRLSLDAHESIPVIIGGKKGTINGNLVIVDSKSVPLSVSISEEPCLQESVVTSFYSRYQVCWRKSNLLSLIENATRVAVQGQSANLD